MSRYPRLSTLFAFAAVLVSAPAYGQGDPPSDANDNPFLQNAPETEVDRSECIADVLDQVAEPRCAGQLTLSELAEAQRITAEAAEARAEAAEARAEETGRMREAVEADAEETGRMREAAEADAEAMEARAEEAAAEREAAEARADAAEARAYAAEAELEAARRVLEILRSDEEVDQTSDPKRKKSQASDDPPSDANDNPFLQNAPETEVDRSECIADVLDQVAEPRCAGQLTLSELAEAQRITAEAAEARAEATEAQREAAEARADTAEARADAAQARADAAEARADAAEQRAEALERAVEILRSDEEVDQPSDPKRKKSQASDNPPSDANDNPFLQNAPETEVDRSECIADVLDQVAEPRCAGQLTLSELAEAQRITAEAAEARAEATEARAEEAESSAEEAEARADAAQARADAAEARADAAEAELEAARRVLEILRGEPNPH